jgi:diguanylate cyclase (GGDEF)-like protein
LMDVEESGVLEGNASRLAAAGHRALAFEMRSRAAADREQAARDREQAAQDRAQALAEREALLHQLSIAETDALTGTRTRAPGLAELQREIQRARRTTGKLAIAYTDVVGLKTVNDTASHAAGNILLKRVVGAMRSHLRPYDPIIRVGGDEFVCEMPDATADAARERFATVQSALTQDPEPCAIKVGFAALEPEDSADALINRADADLPHALDR